MGERTKRTGGPRKSSRTVKQAAPMKVAIVVNTRWWRASIDLEGYAEELAKLGHSVLLVCQGNDAGKAAFPVVEASAAQMQESAFWSGLHIDVAITFSWLYTARLTQAMRTAGIRVIGRADNDGQVSVRVFPKAAWLRTVAPAQGLRDGLRRVKHWAHRWLSLSKGEDADLIETIRASSAVAIESEEAAKHLGTILDYYGQGDLRSRFHVVPHSVTSIFLDAPVGPAKRPPMIFCGGRWDDPQKDAPLLSHTLQALLAKRPDAGVTLAGPGAELAFARWKHHPQVQVTNHIPRDTLPELLANYRFILSSSRWESQPIGTLETLCLGLTVVAPALPGFIGLADEGRSGTLSAHRHADSLAEAAVTELKKWDALERDPQVISTTWRKKVSNEAVVKGLLASLD